MNIVSDIGWIDLAAEVGTPGAMAKVDDNIITKTVKPPCELHNHSKGANLTAVDLALQMNLLRTARDMKNTV